MWFHKPVHRKHVWNSGEAVFQSETQDYLRKSKYQREFRFLGPAWNTLRQNLHFPPPPGTLGRLRQSEIWDAWIRRLGYTGHWCV